MAISRLAIPLFALLSAGSFFDTAFALPTSGSTLSARDSITNLTSAQISSYSSYSYYAAAGYCTPNTTITWTCGTNCEATTSFTPIASGGDESSTPRYWYVGYDSSLKEIIVSHQGTFKSNILMLVEDATIIRRKLDSDLFPGLSTSIHAHTGFADSQEKTASSVLAAVKTAMSKYSVSKVTIVGHSLGAAVGLLDAIYLPLQISGLTVRFVGYGLPRVGNQEFADYVDSQSSTISVTHINNQEDFIPILPGRSLGYHHPSGEVHILDSGSWVSCPGQDNTSDECTTGDVSSILAGDIDDHGGPYNGISMGASTCA